jgi:hypothetical protein
MVRSMRQGGETGVDITCVRVQKQHTRQKNKTKKNRHSHETKEGARTRVTNTHETDTTHIKLTLRANRLEWGKSLPAQAIGVNLKEKKENNKTITTCVTNETVCNVQNETSMGAGG